MESEVIRTSETKSEDQCDMGESKDAFTTWLSGKLQQYNADDEVFLPYILSILEEAECSSSQSDSDTLDSLSDILEGLGLDENCSNQENSNHLKKEIWTKWNKAISLENTSSFNVNGEGAVGGAREKVDIQTQLARITESRSEAYQASAKAAAERQNPTDEQERKAVKAAILAQYQNVVGEESENSDEGIDNERENELTAMRNENKEFVAKAEQEKREKCRAAALAKKEKDKEDREKQKKDQEDRKKKAQDKANKGERKR